MRLRAAVTGGIAALVLLVPAATADTVVNPFAGQWSTTLDNTTPGTVKFSVINSSDGAASIQDLHGHPCQNPTTYYHGDFSDTPSGGSTQTGTMTACTVSSGHLVGRWYGSGDGGDIDLMLNSSGNAWSGDYSDDTYAMTYTYTGTFQSHFPGDGCCTSSGGGGGSGSGGSLALPTKFCPSGGKCAPKKALTVAEKYSALKDRRSALVFAVFLCGYSEDPEERGQYQTLCVLALSAYKEADALVNDPPDPAFNTLTVAPLPGRAPRAHAAACPSRLSASQCSALNTAFANYTSNFTTADAVAGYLADGANKVTAAVAANSPASAFFQTAYAKVNAGALAVDLVDEQHAGQALANLLNSDGLAQTVTVQNDKKILRKLPHKLLSGKLRKSFMSQLSSIRGSVSTSLLAAPIDYSGYLAAYESISLSDLAAIVYGDYTHGLSSSVAQTLDGDLQKAQSDCGTPSQRIADINQFISDAKTGAGSDGSFLAFGAKPLLAQNLPSSSCQ